MRHFQDELDGLKAMLVGMAGLAEEAVRLAVEALLERDLEKAALVSTNDDRVDELEVQVDNHAMSLLALQQPMAKDLRLITIAMKISNDLERRRSR